MSLRRGTVYYQNLKAGLIEEEEDQYRFQYLPEYLADPHARAVSLTLPLREELFTSERLFSFFDGLIPEGWLLETAEKNWKLDPRDRMGLLLACCRDTIGAVTVERAENE
ncbi:HipA N-terminal domain-containing protein, partial [Leadbettera azotonutricia]|uniref:HipA N-terminal domain protein n=1 Tax=Leadbettera azotonutricia (strain ATCC BAA-888 / DSM 13862 / ZAS-9) TaxID=545695 RepID=F5Y9U8_LEAAZ